MKTYLGVQKSINKKPIVNITRNEDTVKPFLLRAGTGHHPAADRESQTACGEGSCSAGRQVRQEGGCRQEACGAEEGQETEGCGHQAEEASGGEEGCHGQETSRCQETY